MKKRGIKQSKRTKTKLRLWKRDSNQTISGVKYATCHYCTDSLPLKQVTLDHVIPLSKGGTNDDENLVLSCLKCNGAKGTDEWYPAVKSNE